MLENRKLFRQFVFLALAASMLAAFVEAQLVSVGRRNARSVEFEIDNTRLIQDVEYLSSDELEGRAANRPSIAKTRDFIERRFRESGLLPFRSTYRQGFTITDERAAASHPGVNIIGYIKGRKYPDRYIVVTAHYDHDGIKDGQIYNGADDNASGTSALFAIASALSKSTPNHSFIFVAFDAEEQRLQGSRYFVGNLPVKRESIALNVNMDMVSRSDKGELYAAGTARYPQLKPAMLEAQKRAKVKLLLGHDGGGGPGMDDWTNQSDHAAFHAVGIPFIYFGVEDHADYHKPTDDFRNMMPDFYGRAVETILASVLILDGRKL